MANHIARLLGFFKDNGSNTWRNIEYFNKNWKTRIKKMSAHIDLDSSVVDLGCGPMWLKSFLPPSVTYFPVDYKDRGPECIVQDFNQQQYPDVTADTAFVSGCLEYIDDPAWFISEICKNHATCILSYCTTEYFPGKAARMRKAWVNSLSEAQIIDMFSELGFALGHKANEKMYMIFVFRKRVNDQESGHQ